MAANDKKTTYETLKALFGGNSDPAVAKPVSDVLVDKAEKQAPLENRQRATAVVEQAFLNMGPPKDLLKILKAGIDAVFNRTLSANKLEKEARAENRNDDNRPKL